MNPPLPSEQATLARLITFRVLAAIGIVSSHCLVFQTPASLSGLEIRALVLARDFGVAGFFLIGGVFLARSGFGLDYVLRRWQKVLPPVLGIELAHALFTMGGSGLVAGRMSWDSAYWLWFIYYYLSALLAIALVHRWFGSRGIALLFAACVATAAGCSLLAIEPGLGQHRVVQALLQVSAGALIGLSGLRRLAGAPALVAALCAVVVVGVRLNIDEQMGTVVLQLLYALAVFTALPASVVRHVGRLDFHRVRRPLFGIFLVHGFVVAAVSAALEMLFWGRVVSGNVMPAGSFGSMMMLWAATTAFVFVTSGWMVHFTRRATRLVAGAAR